MWLGPDDLRVHPDGDAYYSGDLISFQVYAHHGHDWGASSPPDVDLEIWLGAPGEGELIAEDRVVFYGEQEGEARLEWVWDTTGLVGPQTLSVWLDPDDEIQIGDEEPDNNLVTYTVEFEPAGALPDVWSSARWVQQESACCVFHYISGSAAERDIEALMALADGAIAFVGERLQATIDQDRLDVYLIDRVLGHGGFASGELVISYLDRFYAGGDFELVLRHEGTHVLDQQFAEIRPALLTEGLAVTISGGHFRPEPLTGRAAALLTLDRYIPLAELADDFYPLQHEIGYLEAAGFVTFLIDRFRWEPFKAFYGDIRAHDGGQAAMIDAALQDHFGLTLSQAETEWLAVLRALPESTDQATDLRLTVSFYDTVRRYQQSWDPSAYFLEAWLPLLPQAEEREITADLMRHPSGLLNVTLETMFIAADRAIDGQDYVRAEDLLGAINNVLDAGGDLRADPLADQYRALVQVTAVAGYEAQQIQLDLGRNTARVLAAAQHTANIVQLDLTFYSGNWRVVSTN